MGLETAAIATMAGWLGTAVLGAGAVAGGAAAMNSMSKKSSGSDMSPSVLPTAPSYASAGATAVEQAKKRKKSQTILTAPLSGTEEYGTSAPTLLGSGAGKTTLGA
jgi:hypothetical protein